MTETEFLQHVKVLFDAIIEQIEEQNADLDVLAHGALLEIESDNGQKVIINQQTALNEVWLASREGGYHFKLVNGTWINTRDGVDFWTYFDRTLVLLNK